MDIRNCRRCGRIFNYDGRSPICPACLKKAEEDFQKVKEYVRSNPNSGIGAVANECEVDIAQIRQWVREERLEFSSSAGTDMFCESCGKPITTGRYCNECKKKMAIDMDKSIVRPAAPKPEPAKRDSEGNKMRFLGGR